MDGWSLESLSLSDAEFENSVLAREYLDYISESLENAYRSLDSAAENLRLKVLSAWATLIEDAELTKGKKRKRKTSRT